VVLPCEVEDLACVQEEVWLQMALQEVAVSCSLEHQEVVWASEVEMLASAEVEGWV